MTAFWMAATGYLLGAMPFSVWVGQLLLHKDIRRLGDGNPGAANAWRAGTWKAGLPALALDFLKGAAPTAVARFVLHLNGWGLAIVALAPVVGHAFSPFLGFRGGKALAVTFGIWTGLTLWEGPTVLGLLYGASVAVQSTDAWSAVPGMLCLLGYFLLRGAAWPILAVCCGNLAILVWTHRIALRQAPQVRPYVRRLVGRG